VCVLLSTPYMDEAARCHRIGFMRKGQIIAEGTPGKLRSLLSERILELRGSPLPLLRKIAAGDPGIEDVHAFGDHLHIRLVKTEGKDQPRQPQRPALGAAAVIQRLKIAIPAGGGIFTDARSIPAVLEDVFIALSNQEGQPEELLQ
jgi:ABC-2 type transport system ATP-binding protein